MIDEETLFVLGAGASKPYGYPTGKGLRDYLSDELINEVKDLLIDSEYEKPEQGQMIRSFKTFADFFKQSSIPSIDQWLALRPEFAETGKISICFKMLQCEYQNPDIYKIDDLCYDWYELLWHRMTEGFSIPSDIDRLRENRVSFITFNYDRSLEQFFYRSIVHSFGELAHMSIVSPIDCAIPFPFFHVYGQVDLPAWKGGSNYGRKPSMYIVRESSANIKIINDRNAIDNTSISELFSKANRVFFLGFGFAPENMKIIGIPSQLSGKKVYGTVLGYTKREKEKLHDHIRHGAKIDSSWVVLEEMDSYSLLREYL